MFNSCSFSFARNQLTFVNKMYYFIGKQTIYIGSFIHTFIVDYQNDYILFQFLCVMFFSIILFTT